MNPLARFERLIEGVVEGGLAARLKHGVEPAELARKLERAMDASQRIGTGGIRLVDNWYRLGMHPADDAEVEPFRQTLERELASFLGQEARQRGWRLAPRPRVVIERDPTAPLHRPGVSSALLDVDDPRLAPAVPDGATARLDRDAMVRDTETRVRLLPADGDAVVEVARLPFTIGRSLDCDLPIEDGRVSRVHAQLMVQGARVALVDMGSTNGTRVNGSAIERCLLRDGDRLSFGGIEWRVQLT